MITHENIDSTARYIATEYCKSSRSYDSEIAVGSVLNIVLKYLMDYHPESVQGVCQEMENMSELYKSLRINII